MPDLEIARQAIAIAMLSAASYQDIKSRTVNDITWIIPGSAGAAMYIFEPASSMTIMYLACGVLAGIASIILRLFGQADGLAVIALAVILPAHGRLPVPLLVLLAAPLLAGAYGLSRNVAYNTSDLLCGRLFCGICEKTHRKVLAFFVLHQKRRHEKFVFQAQSGDKFVFFPRPGTPFAGSFCGHIVSAQPIMPFMLVFLAYLVAVPGPP